MVIPKKELKNFLDLKVETYNRSSFIASDPIQIPHQFSTKEDVEIAGFLSATIAWGNRTMIIRNSKKMMEIMDNSPFDFVMNHSNSELKTITNFVHRTFNSTDFQYFIKSLQNIYKHHKGMESVLKPSIGDVNYQNSIANFKQIFFELSHESRTEKHISNPLKNSAAKRIHMFLRWMVRNDSTGVDFGLWRMSFPAFLSCPLDVHSGNVARKLGILTRKQNDWKAVYELDTKLRAFDKNDPVKYDFALFGLGVFEKF
tara:strand:+ start:1472 stop:2242 length:771 start_codon:yes stop_codon:yes gene_type:complete